MIKPGFYRFETLDQDGHTSWGTAEVLENEGTLIKVKFGRDGIRILNTAASTFISATPVDRREDSSGLDIVIERFSSDS